MEFSLQCVADFSKILGDIKELKQSLQREKECQNFGAPDKTAIKFLIWTGDDTSHANDTYFDPAMVLAANAFVANSLAEVR